MKAKDLLKVLERDLGYAETRRSGSHRRLKADGRPPITWAFHDRTLAPVEVRNVLVKQIGLDADEALKLL